jgi:hypothetical protein
MDARFPCASVVVHLTSVSVLKPKLLPEGGSQATPTVPVTRSLAVASYVTITRWPAPTKRSMSSCLLNAGGVVSTTRSANDRTVITRGILRPTGDHTRFVDVEVQDGVGVAGHLGCTADEVRCRAGPDLDVRASCVDGLDRTVTGALDLRTNGVTYFDIERAGHEVSRRVGRSAADRADADREGISRSTVARRIQRIAACICSACVVRHDGTVRPGRFPDLPGRKRDRGWAC